MSDKDRSHVVPMDDDVTHYPADVARLQTFESASEMLSRFEAPQLVNVGNVHERLYVAAFDGTGNDKFNDPLHATNIARISDQLEALNTVDAQVHVRYLEGPGTQDNRVERTLDLARGHSYEARLEEMYEDLVKKTNVWRDADPEVKIRVLSVGFSRGASQSAGFSNLLHDRGIVDLDSRFVDADGRIVYTRHIVPPGRTPQAVALFDPVATGVPERFDRRLARSVVSGFQITAMDEVRAKFPSDRVMPLGLSGDGRFLNLQVAGAHSDIGGGYLRDGLAIRSCNLMVDYCNALRPGSPMLHKAYEPADPRLNVVHRSEEGMLLYQVDRKVDRALPAGVNARLAPDILAARDGLPHAPRPLGPEIERGPLAKVQIGPTPTTPGEAALVSLARIEAGEAAGLAPLPGAVRLARAGVVGLGVAASAVDAVHTGNRLGLLYGQSNATAAQSELEHFGARGVGGWVGGAATGAALGWETGPGVIAFVAVGAIAGSSVGEQLADRWDRRKIYHQTDQDGVDWSFNGRQWLREDLGDLVGDGVDDPRRQSFSALPEKASELNYRASNTMVALAMGDASAPRSPYRLPAADGDRPSLRQADWTHDPRVGQWSRNVATGLDRQDKPIYEPELAGAQRAGELDRMSLQVVDANIASSPVAMAARYELAYRGNGWEKFGPMPAAVQVALSGADVIMASDGNEYRRDMEGTWSQDGEVAQGNRALELDATRAVLQPALAEHAQRMTTIQAPSPMSPEQRDRANLMAVYAVHGVAPNSERMQASLLAVRRTREAEGIDRATTALGLEPAADGGWSVDSPIPHLRKDSDGVVRVLAMTSAGEMRQALDDVRGHGAASKPEASGLRAMSPSPVDRNTAMPQDHDAPASRSVSARPVGPDDPSHPDHALLEQIRTGVRKLDKEAGRAYDERSECLSRSLLAACKDNSDMYPDARDHSLAANALSRADHVLVGPTGNAFVVEGRLEEPAHKRAVVSIEQAMQTPVEQSDARLQAASQAIAQEQAMTQQQGLARHQGKQAMSL